MQVCPVQTDEAEGRDEGGGDPDEGAYDYGHAGLDGA